MNDWPYPPHELETEDQQRTQAAAQARARRQAEQQHELIELDTAAALAFGDPTYLPAPPQGVRVTF